MKRTKRLFAVLMAAAAFFAAVSLCVFAAGAPVESFNGKRVGTVTGTSFDKMLEEKYPDSEVTYFNALPDMVMALKSGKIDAFVHDRPVAERIIKSEGSLAIAEGIIAPDDYGFVFPKTEKGEQMRVQFNEYFGKIKASGELEKIKTRRFDDDDESYTELPSSGKNGFINVATTANMPPFSFVTDKGITGFDFDLVAGFCKEYGYGAGITDIDSSGFIAGITSGKYDMYVAAVSITEERKQSVLFTDPVYNGGVVMVCRGEGNNSSDWQISDLSEKHFGIKEGSIYDKMTPEMFPDAKTSYYKGSPDLALALSEGKIDCFMASEPSARVMIKERPEFYIVGGSRITDEEYAFAFAKNEQSDKIRAEMNEFLKKAWSDGTIEEADKIWFGDDESLKTVDMDGLLPKNGTLRFAVCTNQTPFCYLKDGKVVGYDVYLAVKFCREYGYGLNIADMDFAALIPGITSGKYDLAAGCITITPERAESVNFSDADYKGGVVILAKKASAAYEEKGFFDSIAESFEKTFVRENRWQLILSGIGTTMLIAVCAAAAGTVLGFGVCMLRRSKRKPLAVIAQIYIRLLQGTPIVVFLMILFYVVFGSASIDPMWVAVVGFAMNFAAYCAEIMRTGLDAVDNGQIEAAKALGFTPASTFLQVVMPQAARHFLPVYKGELISLVKSTSVVGYIAVQDLTKVSDIIRSRTYEAFFPLIATAVIYFLLAWLLTIIINLIMKKIEPNKKKRTVKGVTMK